jgi:toxin ParE1/3/4
MRRLRVEFRPSANVDIAAIFEYIFEASRSSAVAGRFVRRVIAYIVEGGAVQITNIFYGGRDYEASTRAGRPLSPKPALLLTYPFCP